MIQEISVFHAAVYGIGLSPLATDAIGPQWQLFAGLVFQEALTENNMFEVVHCRKMADGKRQLIGANMHVKRQLLYN